MKAGRTTADVVPLPTARAEPVLQVPRRGRYPRAVVRLSTYRLNKALAAASDARLQQRQREIDEARRGIAELEQEVVKLLDEVAAPVVVCAERCRERNLRQISFLGSTLDGLRDKLRALGVTPPEPLQPPACHAPRGLTLVAG